MRILSIIIIGFTGAYINGYVPTDAQCPSVVPLRHSNGDLSEDESRWLQNRDSKTKVELMEWLEASNMADFNVSSYLSDKNDSMRIGLAFSGGGFRAMLSGAGMLAALDKNTPMSNDLTTGGLGGLLQASTYISGLSGGSWLVGSLAMNNWTSIPQMQSNKTLWNFQNPFDPGDGSRKGLMGMLQSSWGTSVVVDVFKKQDAGYPISISDVWGRLLSAQLFPGSDHGSGLLWSDLLSYKQITDFSMPLPILVCDSYNITTNPSWSVHSKNENRSPSQQTAANLAVVNSSLIEVTPFEFGSSDPAINAFTSTKYLGSSLGNAVSYAQCVIGMDNVGFLVGASSSLFNIAVPQILSIGPLRSIYNSLLKTFGGFQNIMYALIGPNPFMGASWVSQSLSEPGVLKLVDGGEDGQNIPLVPLIRPERQLDVVFAFDSSADTSQNWPSGQALFNTYRRQTAISGNPASFPMIPDPGSMVKWGMNQRPTFFGCNLNKQSQYSGPILIYIPNNYKSYPANQNTFKLNYSPNERDGMITNGYNVMTLNNGTMDTEWRQCLACSIILRTQQHNGDNPTEQCTKCFQRYCYG